MEISPEIENQILQRLAETANRNKVIEEICLEHGWHWQAAEEVVDHLVQFHRLELTRRQSPALLLAALGVFSGGVILVAWNLLGALNYFWPYLDPKTPDELGLYLFYSDLFQSLLFYPQALPLFITGLAMMVGSTLGLKEVWASFFDLLDQERQSSLIGLLQRTWRVAQPEPLSESPDEADFLPSEKLLNYLVKRLPEEQSEIQLVEELWLKFGLAKSRGAQLVRLVQQASGTGFTAHLTLPLLLTSTAASFTGLMWVVQYLLLVSSHLAAQPRPLTDQWQFILRLGELGAFVEKEPWGLAWFSLGLILLVGGFYGLKDTWPSIFQIQKGRV
jgi:hypothetical protein